MKDRKLAFRYARALLSSVGPGEPARQVERFLLGVGKTMEESREMREVLLDPAVAKADRMKLLTDLAGHYDMPVEVHRFMDTVVEHRRIRNIPEMAELFRELREAADGIVPASVTTATPMDDAMTARVRLALEKMTGKNVRLTVLVDPGLIGGAVTRIGSMVYDGSLETQLKMLRNQLVEG
ncbi:MAG: ATP synthase F1 subunit delta [Acidobacteria bacterium]|uniref:ATP synthase subunit delta n=1 Tax=Candidatus Polarisedimenticola svalbardensis TaxID=2886004 RepID=A0A8J6Y2D6_9BACT|nr:ATP synthase F1 subunit delta [Candidatus Polarisedimenticola svalbardensis]